MDFCFSDDFLKALEFSRDEAVRTGWHNVSPDHIVLGILRHSDNDACVALDALGANRGLFKESIDEALFCPDQVSWEERGSVFPSDSAVSMIQHAALEAARCGSGCITPMHYLLACCRMAGCYSHEWLAENGVELKALAIAGGVDWARYGLGGSSKAQDSRPDTAPDPMLLASAIEQRLREGFDTGNPHVS